MAGFDIREMMNDIDEAPGKVWFWDLEQAVIDADRCVQCGVCVAACPTDSIGIGSDDLPELVKMCTGCSLCWDFCPRGGLQYEATWKISGEGNGHRGNGLGHVQESFTAKVDPEIRGRPGRRVRERAPDLASRERRDRRRPARPRERDRAVEGRGVPRDHPGRGPRVRRLLLQPDARPGPRGLQGLRPAAEPAHSGRRDAVRDRGHKGHAGEAVDLGHVAGRGDHPDDRAALHQELQLREADARGDPGQARASTSTPSAGWTSSAASSSCRTSKGRRSSRSRSGTSTAPPSRAATSARTLWATPRTSPSAPSAARTATRAS